MNVPDNGSARSRRMPGWVRRSRTALAVRPYRSWWLATFVGQQGTRATMICQVALLSAAGASPAEIGWVVGLSALPKLVVAPVAGVFGDRVDARRAVPLMAVLQALPNFLLAVFVWLQLVDSAWPVMVAALLGATAGSLALPMRGGQAIRLLHDDDPDVRKVRHAGRTHLESINMACAKALTPLLVGVLIEAGGGGPRATAACLALATVTFASQWFLLRRALVEQTKLPVAERRGLRAQARGVLHDWAEAFSEVRSLPVVAYGLGALAVVSLLTFNINVVLPVLAFELFSGGAILLAWLLGAFGVGQLAGGLWRPAARGSVLSYMLGLSFVLAAASFVAAIAWLPLVLAMVAVTGWATAAMEKTVNRELGEVAKVEMGSRFTTLHMLAYDGVTAIGAPAVGYAMSAFGPRAGLVIGGIGALLGAVVLLVGMRRTRTAG